MRMIVLDFIGISEFYFEEKFNRRGYFGWDYCS